MFYYTQIKSVTDFGAVDMQGRSLFFIGDLPVRAGDWVFTDGRFIFGNSSHRGSSNIIAAQSSGIPILGNVDSEKNAMRGYITKSGQFKKFPIAIDDWIVNSDRYFAHGSKFFNGVKIIDASFSDTQENIIIAGGFFYDNHILYFTEALIEILESRVGLVGGYPGEPDEAIYIQANYPYVFGQTFGSNEFSNLKINAQIYADGSKRDELDLKPYAQDINNRALYCAEQIMRNNFQAEMYTKKSHNGLWEHVRDFFPAPIEVITRRRRGWNPDVPYQLDRPADPPPDKPFIVHSAVHILTCNYSHGKLDGLIFASTYGYCFPRIQPRFTSVFGVPKDYYDTSKYDYELIEEFKCVPFGFSAFYRIGSTIPIAYRNFGGVVSDVTFIPDDFHLWKNWAFHPSSKQVTSCLQSRHIELTAYVQSLELKNNLRIPVGDGFFNMNKFGRLSFFNSKYQEIARDIPVHDNLFYIEILDAYFSAEHFSFTFNNKPILRFNLYRSDATGVEATINLDYTDSDSNSDTIKISDDSAGVPPIDGYYILNDDNSVEPLQFTPLFYELDKDTYLYGIKDGKLFLKTKNIVQVIDDKIKNFRLFELKNINKAKK